MPWQEIQACWRAFAAIKADGSVVTWGEASSGGDSSHVQEQLKDVQQVEVRVQLQVQLCHKYPNSCIISTPSLLRIVFVMLLAMTLVRGKA